MRVDRHLLRPLAWIAVSAAIVDPGCVRPARPSIAVATAGDLPSVTVARILADVRAAAPWATVMDESASGMEPPTGEPVARVVAGDPAPTLQALRSRAAAVAVRVEPAALTVGGVVLPARVVAGSRVDAAVMLEDVPAEAGHVRVAIGERGSGLVQAETRVDASAARDGRLLVHVPWMPTATGEVLLATSAAVEAPTTVRAAPVATTPVTVVPPDVAVRILDARPTWTARFARLALLGASAVSIESETRVAPGIVVRRREGQDGPDHDPQVIVVGGVESLTAADVSALERAVRVRGRALILVVDAPPAPGPWRRLWPGDPGVARQAERAVTGHVAGHAWKVREWLAPSLSTTVRPLAYLDSGTAPIIVGRALGAGRVVLVTAMDAWRWRADDDVAYPDGWRSLVQRLAIDVPEPLGVQAWVSGQGRVRHLQVDVTVRPDVDSGVTPTAVWVADGGEQSLPLTSVAPGRWRGAVRATGSRATVRVSLSSGGDAGGTQEATVDLRDPMPAASWQDVARYQADRGALAADGRTLRRVLDTLRTRWPVAATERWYVTRTWWFAALVLAALGGEWIARRLRGER